MSSLEDGCLCPVCSARAKLISASSFKLLIAFPILYLVLEQGKKAGYIHHNPIKYLLFLQGELPNGLYTKVWSDLAFVLHHVIFWSLCVTPPLYG